MVVFIRVRVLVSQFDSGNGFWWSSQMRSYCLCLGLFGGFEIFCVVCKCVLRFAKLGVCKAARVVMLVNNNKHVAGGGGVASPYVTIIVHV